MGSGGHPLHTIAPGAIGVRRSQRIYEDQGRAERELSSVPLGTFGKRQTLPAQPFLPLFRRGSVRQRRISWSTADAIEAEPERTVGQPETKTCAG